MGDGSKVVLFLSTLHSPLQLAPVAQRIRASSAGGGPAYGGSGPFNTGGFSSRGGPASGWNVNMDDFGDIFSGMGFGDIFGGHRSSRGAGRAGRTQERGADIEMNLTIDFKEAIFGVEKNVPLYKTIVCKKCNGNGAEPGTAIKICNTCGGSGQTAHVQRTILGNFQTVTICRECHGQGKRPEKNCRDCGGLGVTKDHQTITVTIPAGIDSGETLRLSSQGEAGKHGGGAGDLFISIRIRPDDNFKREGQTIYSNLVLKLSEAVLGATKTVATVDGNVDLKIPAGTQSGMIFRLKGKGVPEVHKTQRGDHLVEITVKMPEKLSKKAKELFEELKKESL